MSTRLTAAIRSDIYNRVIADSPYSEESSPGLDEARNAVIDHYLSVHEVVDWEDIRSRGMERLGDLARFFNTDPYSSGIRHVNVIYINNVPGLRHTTISIVFPKAIHLLAPVDLSFNYTLLTPEFKELVDDYLDKWTAYTTEKKEFSEALSTALRSVTTVAKLIRSFPELEPYARRHLPESAGSVLTRALLQTQQESNQ